MSLFDGLLGRDRSSAPDLTSEEAGALSSAASPEEAASVCLDWLVRTVRPEAAHAYLLSREDGQYRLCRVYAGVDATAEPNPSYGGLMASARPSDSRAALTLELADVPPEPAVIERGGERRLAVPCQGGLVLMARLRRLQPVPPDLLGRVSALARVAGPLVALARRLSESAAEVDRLRSSLAASRMVSEAALRPHRSLELLFHLPLGLLGVADGGLILAGAEGDGPTLAASAGRGALLCVRILGGSEPQLVDLPSQPDLLTGEDLGNLHSQGVHAVARIPAILGEKAIGCAYYFFDESPQFTRYQLAVLSTLGDRFAQVISSSRMVAETAGQYLYTLRSLVTAMDSVTPHTIGHSDRIARYARMTARELGLPAPECEAAALGAYLHDVGMVAIDLNLITRTGRLAPQEHQRIQEHTQVGAELVGTVQAALPVAAMVAHHHERWDGRGYPHRLRGTEIPLGARIIAVCDLFEAKTTGRAYRKPLPFARALADVQAAAGTQLDPEVVAAFVRSWRTLRLTARQGRPLARCWEMRQLPAAVCGDCPTRLRSGTHPCWEEPEKRCTRHGDECATCIIYTEALTRLAGGVAP